MAHIGAYITIANLTGADQQVSFSDVSGMNEMPKGGIVEAGKVYGPSYMETSLTGTSAFTLVAGLFSPKFNVSSNGYWVEDKTSYADEGKDDTIRIAIAQVRKSGEQDTILAILYKNSGAQK